MNNGKYNDEIAAKICEIIADGSPNKFAAHANGISEDTFYEWMKVHPEFSEQVKKAQAEAVNRNVRIIKQAATRSWQAAGWWLERTQRNDFSLKQEISAEVKGEQTIIYKPEKKAEGTK